MTDTSPNAPANQKKTPREKLIAQTEYLAGELASGDAVPVAVLVKARPFVDTLLKELAPVNVDPKVDTAKLQLAMIDVMAAIAPVTISSLEATECSVKTHRGLLSAFKPPAKPDQDEAQLGSVEAFSNGLVMAAVAFLMVALGVTLAIQLIGNGELLQPARNVVSADPKKLGDMIKALAAAAETFSASRWGKALTIIQPVLYGGLGACIYLLRSLHKNIYERTFDRRYQPEYVNRIVLGMISGAVVTLLAKEIGNIKELAGISGAALAFIIGYNTDLLFSLIERISYALFPKVPDPPPATVTPPLQAQKPDGDAAVPNTRQTAPGAAGEASGAKAPPKPAG